MENSQTGVEPQQPPQDISTPATSKKISLISVAIALVIVLVVITVVLYLTIKSNLIKKDRPTTQTAVTTSLSQKNSQALISSVPHFNNLTLQDLPYFSDIRYVFDYNGHKIIYGNDSLLEYNQTTKQFVRQNNPDVLPCIYSAALIGNNLFIGCNGKTLNDTSILYKVDLKSGKIIKTYTTLITFGHKLINIGLASIGNTLWISSWDGVIKMNINSEQIQQYAPSQVLPHGCGLDAIWVDNNTVMVSSGQLPCTSGNQFEVGSYNYQTDTWQPSTMSSSKYRSIIDRRSDYSLEIPQFYAISEQVNKKYYLFSQNGVYTVSEGKFPQPLFLHSSGIESSAAVVKALVTSDESSAIEFGVYGGLIPQNPTIANQVYATLINLHAKEETDLIANNPSFLLPVSQNIQQDLDDPTDITLQESPDGISIKNKNGQSFAKVNLKTKTLLFQ